MAAYAVVDADEAENAYAGSDVPGEFRRLTEALGAEQLAATLIRVPPHSDFDRGPATSTRRRSARTATTVPSRLRSGRSPARSTTAMRPRSTTSGSLPRQPFANDPEEALG